MEGRIRWLIPSIVAVLLVSLGAGLHAFLQPRPDWELNDTPGRSVGGFTGDGEHFYTAYGHWPDEPIVFLYLHDRRSGSKTRSLFPQVKVLSWLTYSEDGRFLAGGTPGAGISVADFKEQREWFIPLPAFDKPVTTINPPRIIAISPQARLLSVSPAVSSLQLVDLRQPFLFDFQTGKPAAEDGRICYDFFAPDDRHLGFLAEKQLTVWNCRARKDVLHIETDPYSGFRFSPDGRWFVCRDRGEANEPIRHTVWNLNTYQPQAVLPLRFTREKSFAEIEFTPDSRLLITYPHEPAEQNDLEIWDPANGARLGGHSLGEACQRDVVVAADSSRLLVVTRDLDYRKDDVNKETTVRLLELPSGKVRWERQLPGGEPRSEPERLLPAPRFSSDGAVVVLRRRAEAGWDFLDASTGRLINSIRFTNAKEEVSNSYARSQSSADGQYLLTYAYPEERLSPFLADWKRRLRSALSAGDGMHTIAVVADSTTGSEVIRIDLPGHARFILSPDGKSLVASRAGTTSAAHLSCWTLPARRPWEWIAGVPLTIAAALIACKQLRVPARWLKRRH